MSTAQASPSLEECIATIAGGRVSLDTGGGRARVLLYFNTSEEAERAADAVAVLHGLTSEAWQSMETAPRDGTQILAARFNDCFWEYAVVWYAPHMTEYPWQAALDGGFAEGRLDLWRPIDSPDCPSAAILTAEAASNSLRYYADRFADGSTKRWDLAAHLLRSAAVLIDAAQSKREARSS